VLTRLYFPGNILTKVAYFYKYHGFTKPNCDKNLVLLLAFTMIVVAVRHHEVNDAITKIIEAFCDSEIGQILQ
jgi:hypothetical protein